MRQAASVYDSDSGWPDWALSYGGGDQRCAKVGTVHDLDCDGSRSVLQWPRCSVRKDVAIIPKTDVAVQGKVASKHKTKRGHKSCYDSKTE